MKVAKLEKPRRPPLLLSTGVNPIEAYWVMVSTSFGSKFGISGLLVKTTPIILTVLQLRYQMGLWNIGAEEKFYMGAFVASIIALSDLSFALPVMFVVSALAGLAWVASLVFLEQSFSLTR